MEAKEVMFNDNIAHIVYASDDHFSEILGVSLVSLYENSRDLTEIIVYILDSGISKESKNKIESISHSYLRHPPIWLKAKDISCELSMEVAVDRGSLAQYARLFVSSDLPSNLSRVLYLDCDIVIMQSIKELWNLDMNGKTIAALMDAFSKFYRKNIGLEVNDIMFNSGVMLIDLTRWKEQFVEEKLLNFIKEKNGRIQQGDQGALNSILSHDTYCFEPRFNSVTIFYDFSYREMIIYRKPTKFYTEAEINSATDTPVIIHYTTSFLSKRPWIKGCDHRYVKEWMRYKSLSPWRDNELRETYQVLWKKILVWSYWKLPRGIALHIAGILQAYVRPIMNRFR